MPRLTLHYAHWPQGVPRSVEVPDRNVFDYLAESAGRHPERAAIDYYGQVTSFGDLHRGACALAGFLQQRLDVRKGDRVLLLMQNCPQFAMAYYAILRAGGGVVAINPMSSAEELAYYAQDSAARVLVTTQDQAAKARPLLESGALSGIVVGACADMAGDGAGLATPPAFVRERFDMPPATGMHGLTAALTEGIAPQPVPAGGEALAVIAYTSGTTGKPKGAMLSHRAFSHAIAQRLLWQGERAGLSELAVLPVSHLAGMGILLLAVAAGRTLYMLARWDADAAIALIQHHRIRTWGAVTPMIAEVVDRIEARPGDMSSLTWLFGGATAIPEALAERIERFIGLPLIESYGMTEACAATHINPPQAPRRQCGGIPFVNADARVIHPDTGAELGPCESGEIVMHTPTLFDGYWNRPDATREAFIEIDGKRFLKSGDIGYYDKDGYFYVTDRLKRMINASGLKVWPAEIESVLLQHPAVQEACVISARDAHRGETVKACAVLRPSARGALAPEQLIEWARGRMAAYKVPRIVEFVDSLPRTTTGKVLWRVVQEQQDARDRAVPSN